jgi:hypothetical protein
MNRFETWLSHLSTLVVTASGVVYVWMKYFLVTDDPFALVNHPLQPLMISIHVIAAPFLTFVLGLVVNSHVRRKLLSESRSNRISGLVSLFTFPTMVISGYGLQVLTNETGLKIALVLHLATSTVFALTYVVHQVISLKMTRTVARKKPALVRQQTA